MRHPEAPFLYFTFALAIHVNLADIKSVTVTMCERCIRLRSLQSAARFFSWLHNPCAAVRWQSKPFLIELVLERQGSILNPEGLFLCFVRVK